MGARFYLRYTDDFIIVYCNPVALVSTLPIIRNYLKKNLSLQLHHRKIILRKARQGVDFLGYITLPYYRVLRTKTKRRMIKNLKERRHLFCAGLISADGFNQSFQSYLGLLKHCHGFGLSKEIKRYFSVDNSPCLKT